MIDKEKLLKWIQEQQDDLDYPFTNAFYRGVSACFTLIEGEIVKGIFDKEDFKIGY